MSVGEARMEGATCGEERFYTAPELAKMFRMTSPTSVDKVNQWASAGKIRAYKPGRHWLFKQKDVEAFLKRSCNS
jgi:excisionase family DNA binding protein